MQQLVLLLAALWITPCILTIAPLLETHSSRPQRALLTIPGRPPSSHNRPITLLLRLNGLSLCSRRRCNSTPSHQAHITAVGHHCSFASPLQLIGGALTGGKKNQPLGSDHAILHSDPSQNNRLISNSACKVMDYAIFHLHMGL